MNQFQSKNQQKAGRILNDPDLSVQTYVLPTAQSAIAPAPTVITSGTPDFMTKVKNFFVKPVSAGSKILYWHVALGLVVAFVLYVEMVADRKTQRKLKFW